MDKPWKVIFAFVGVFIAGAIFGGLFTLRASGKKLTAESQPPRQRGQQVTGTEVQRPPSPPLRGNPITPTLMRQFTRRFNLTPDQKESVGKIVGRAGEDFLRLRQENFADTARVTERMYADVSAVLSPEQRTELETMRRELQQKLADKAAADRQKRSEAAGAEGANRGTPSGTPARPKGPGG